MSIPRSINIHTVPRPIRLVMVLIACTLIFQACGIARVGTERSENPNVPSTNIPAAEAGRMLQTGIASWYGPNFHGKATANGEVFNMNDFTAAHRTLPFNTVVQVRNLENGESVNVRINDHGPYVDNRVIDLSRRAARKIDMENTGTANVQIILLEEGDRPVADGLVTNQETFTIQLASYNTEAEASAFARRTDGARVEKVNFSGRTVFRVYYGIYKTAIDARDDQRRLARKGLDGFIKQAEN